MAADTFLVAWRRFPDVPPGEDALPWLYGVARLVLLNSRRSRRRRQLLQDRLSNLRAESAELDDTVGRQDDRQKVRDALRRLKPDDKELLRLITWEGLSHRHVALVLGCSENAVAIRLHRARERLAAQLAKDAGPAGHIRPRKQPPTSDPGGEDDR